MSGSIRLNGVNSGVLSLLLLLSCIEFTQAAYEGCDHAWQMGAGYNYLRSPDYPNYYPTNTACRYKFTAPLDYRITINCTIDFYKPNSNQCGSERFYIATDGDSSLDGSELLCGTGTAIRYSLFESVVLAYNSQGRWGRFTCSMYAQKKPCECGWSVNSKISHGQNAEMNAFPSMVSLKDKTSNTLFCGGAIISHRFILSAAHCASQQPAANVVAFVGAHDLTSTTKFSAQYQISEIISHPSYTSNPTKFDICLYKTNVNMMWSRGVGPICLPRNANTNYVGANVIALGWGAMAFGGPSPPILRILPLKVSDYQMCASKYSGVATIYNLHICTYDYVNGTGDTCQRDSGGPIILQDGIYQTIVGIISFGYPCGIGPNPIGVNERVAYHLAFINQNTGNTACAVPI